MRTLTVDYKFSELNNDKILTLTDESGCIPEDFIKEYVEGRKMVGELEKEKNLGSTGTKNGVVV